MVPFFCCVSKGEACFYFIYKYFPSGHKHTSTFTFFTMVNNKKTLQSKRSTQNEPLQDDIGNKQDEPSNSPAKKPQSTTKGKKKTNLSSTLKTRHYRTTTTQAIPNTSTTDAVPTTTQKSNKKITPKPILSSEFVNWTPKPLPPKTSSHQKILPPKRKTSRKTTIKHYQNQDMMMLSRLPTSIIFRYWMQHYATKYTPQSLALTLNTSESTVVHPPVKFQVSEEAMDRVHLSVCKMTEQILSGVKEILIKEGRVTAKVEDIHDSVYSIAKNQPSLMLFQ